MCSFFCTKEKHKAKSSGLVTATDLFQGRRYRLYSFQDQDGLSVKLYSSFEARKSYGVMDLDPQRWQVANTGSISATYPECILIL
jgi:hypothetical protein